MKARFHWTIGSRFIVAFVAAMIIGFAAMVYLQASDQRASLIDLATASLSDKTVQLANAMRIGVMASDGQAIETEFRPQANAPDTQLASLTAFAADGSVIDTYQSDQLDKMDLSTVLADNPTVLSDKATIVRHQGSDLTVITPVLNLRGTKVTGALAIGWSLANQDKAVKAAVLKQLEVAGVVLVLLLALLAVLLSRFVTRPITEVTKVMQRLADGDVSGDIPGIGRHDEIGAIAKTIQIFKDNMIQVRTMAAHEAEEAAAREARALRIEEMTLSFDSAVATILGSVNSAATQMETTASSMATTAGETTRQATTVAAAAEQASDNVQTVASASEGLANSILEIGRQVAEASAVAEEAAQQSHRTNELVLGLADSASRIGEVISLINNIASQTNLLALNATIEAARAGDAGKGFAVVAGEVKMLANQTAKATDDIARQVASVQAGTEKAVAAIGSIGQTISRVNAISSTIAASVGEQSESTQAIARTVQDVASRTQEVTHNISGVGQSAQSNTDMADKVLTAAHHLTTQSDALRDVVQHFLSDVKAA